MCTVTYIPLQKSILFSSSRDENPNRKNALSPAVVEGENKTLLYPADGLASGTWIGLNNSGNLIILLNGGFLNHTRLEKYRLSRGLIVKQLLDSKNLLLSWEQLDFFEIEPFTLIAFSEGKLHQLVWTGHHKIASQPNPSVSHIWSSATLYAPEIQTLRQQWFQHFLNEHPNPDAKSLEAFLRQSHDQENGFNMSRHAAIKTCSISVVEIKQQHAEFEYHDLLQNTSTLNHFRFDNHLNINSSPNNEGAFALNNFLLADEISR